MRFISALLTAVFLVGTTNAQQQDYDLVILGARVVDPETELDQVLNIGITGTEISVITTEAISGEEQIDAVETASFLLRINLACSDRPRESPQLHFAD